MKATKSIVLLLALNKLRKRKNLKWNEKFTADICTVYAEITLLLLSRICITSAPESKNSSPTLLLDDQLWAKVVWKNFPGVLKEWI